MRLASPKPFLLLLGYTAASPAYKGYDIFWEGLRVLGKERPDFLDSFAILIVGVPECSISNWYSGRRFI